MQYFRDKQNDIFCPRDDERYFKCILERSKRTIQYLASLREKQCGAMRTQDSVLLDLVEAKLGFVYASRIMHDQIKDRLNRLPAMLNHKNSLRRCSSNPEVGVK